ncbi:MAG: OmpA family protein, partial [candidate division WOR-3 bacterium]
LIIRTDFPGYLTRIDTMDILGDREQNATITLQPLMYGGLHGGIYDATSRQPIGGIISYRGRVSGEQNIDPRTGTYALRELPAGTYVLTATGRNDNYVPQTCTVKVEPGTLAERSFYLAKQRSTITLEGVTFEPGRADIQPKFHAALDQAGKALAGNPSVVVEIAGHADPLEPVTPEFASSWELSQARANAVRNYLINRFGISQSRLIARGYGDTQPLTPSENETGMERNRRVEFRILSQ